MPWTPPSNEEILLEYDIQDAHKNASRYLDVLSGEGKGGGADGEEDLQESGEASGILTPLVFTLADFTSSLSQDIRPKANSKAWPQLLGVLRQLQQLLARDPPPPQGVDATQHGRLKTTLGNFLTRVQKMEDQAKAKEALQQKEEEEEEEETSLPEVLEEEEEPEEDEEEEAQVKESEKPEEEVIMKDQEKKEEPQEEPLKESAQRQEESPPEEKREEIPEDEDTPPKLVPVAPEREEAPAKERPASEAKKEEKKPEGRPAEPEMGAGDILTVAGILVTVLAAYILYRWMY